MPAYLYQFSQTSGAKVFTLQRLTNMAKHLFPELHA